MSTASSTALKCAPSKLSSRQINPQGQTSLHLALYAECNLVERFNSLKHYRGIATRHDKTARNFLVGLQLVCGLLGSNDGQALAQPQIFRRFLTAILDDIEGYLRTLGQRTESALSTAEIWTNTSLLPPPSG